MPPPPDFAYLDLIEELVKGNRREFMGPDAPLDTLWWLAAKPVLVCKLAGAYFGKLLQCG